MIQLKDSFQSYGMVSILLKLITLLLISFLHINFIVNFIMNTSYVTNLELNLLALIFIVLVLRYSWHKLNPKTPIIFVHSKHINFIIKLVKILSWTSVLLLAIFSFALFFLKAYGEYYIDVLNKTDYYFFQIKIIPFSIIQLVCYSIERIFNIDITKLYHIINTFRIVAFYILAFASCGYVILCIIFCPRSELRRLL